MEIFTNLLKSNVITKGKNKGKAPLRFSFHYKNERFTIGAGERVLVKAWVNDKVTKKEYHYTEINDAIAKKKLFIKKTIEQLEKKELPVTQKILSEHFKAEFNGKPITKFTDRVQPDQANDISIVREFLKNSKTKEIIEVPKTVFFKVVGHHLKKSKNSKETKRKLKQVLKHLIDYEPNFDFKHIKYDFYNDYYLDHLINIPLCDNTIDKHIAELKKLISYGLSRFPEVVKVSSDYHEFKRMYQNPYRLALDWIDVEKIQNFEPLTEDAKISKDLFLISCYTGLRWQNVSQLEPKNLLEKNGKFYLNIVTQKNKKLLTFQLPKTVKTILEKYSKGIPKVYNDDVNSHIQQIARACKIDDDVHMQKLYDGTPQIETFPKWKKITMHVARHTFACEFLKRNQMMGLSALKLLSEHLNHSSIKITEIYWKMVSDEKDKVLINTFD